MKFNRIVFLLTFSILYGCVDTFGPASTLGSSAVGSSAVSYHYPVASVLGSSVLYEWVDGGSYQIYSAESEVIPGLNIDVYRSYGAEGGHGLYLETRSDGINPIVLNDDLAREIKSIATKVCRQNDAIFYMRQTVSISDEAFGLEIIERQGEVKIVGSFRCE